MLEHLKGNKQHLPREHHPHVDRAVAGAGILGQRISHNTPTEHHGRTTAPTQQQPSNDVEVLGEDEHTLHLNDDTLAFSIAMAKRNAAFKKQHH